MRRSRTEDKLDTTQVEKPKLNMTVSRKVIPKGAESPAAPRETSDFREFAAPLEESLIEGEFHSSKKETEN
jgi:hypothetical protein